MKDSGTFTCDDMEPPIREELDCESVAAYRRDYRQYRRGYARGSCGEVGGLSLERKNIKKNNCAPNIDVDFANSAEWGDSYKDRENGTKQTELFSKVTAWRMHYRNFRKGKARGAEGDVEMLAKKLSLSHMRLLPVCQLQEFLRRNKADLNQQAKKTSKLHIHFGAGKLGLGLVVPVLAQIPLVIVQRPSEDWKELFGSAEVSLRVNGEEKLKCRFVGPENENIDEVIGDLQSNPESSPKTYFLCTNNCKFITRLTALADSFTCALSGDLSAKLSPLIGNLPDKLACNRPILYACENDHKAVEVLTHTLKGKVDVVACMVDRICSSRIIAPNSVDILTEPFEGQIVVPPIRDEKDVPYIFVSPPFDHSSVYITSLHSQCNYLTERKFLLVNGSHTTLAFMTLCQRHSVGPLGNYDLLTPATADESQYRQMWGWIVARLLILLWEHEVRVIKDTHKVETDEELVNLLLEYARSTLQRFATVQDKTGRVLSGGVANRYQSRLKSVEEFIDSQSAGSIPLGKVLLKAAGFGMCELGFVIHSLVTHAERFTKSPT